VDAVGSADATSVRCTAGAAANPLQIGNRPRHTAAATVEKRMFQLLDEQSDRQALTESRIAPRDHRADEARMKLA